MSAIDWPSAELGPIRRAKVLGSSIPSAAWVECLLDSPYEQTWRWVTDLEHSVPLFDSTVERIRVIDRQPVVGEEGATHLRIRATTRGVSLPFDVRIEDGFCLMRGKARLYVVVMAAEPEDSGDRTRFVHMEAIPLPGTKVLRKRILREVRSDVANLTRLARTGF